MKAKLKKPKEFYPDPSPWWAKLTGDTALLVGVVPVAIVLAVTGHPEMALSLAGSLFAKFGANFIGEKKST